MGTPVYLMFLFFLVQGFILIVGSQRGILWESKEATWECQKIQKRTSHHCPAEDVWWAAPDPGNSSFHHHFSFALSSSFLDVIVQTQIYEYQFWVSQIFWDPEVSLFCTLQTDFTECWILAPITSHSVWQQTHFPPWHLNGSFLLL